MKLNIEFLIMLPNLIIPGMTKCGTTALWEKMCAHPEFSISKIKESRYFTKDLRKSINFKSYSDYSSNYFFNGFNDNIKFINSFQKIDNKIKWRVDFSNDYSFFAKWSIPAIKKEYFESRCNLPKILFLLREPSKRIRSQVNHNIRNGDIYIDKPILLNKRNHLDLPWTTNYGQMINEYKSIQIWKDDGFEVKVITMEELSSIEIMKRLSDWLELQKPLEILEKKTSKYLVTKDKNSANIIRFIIKIYNSSIITKNFFRPFKNLVKNILVKILF